MDHFILYLLKSSIWIATFWFIYRFFLRSELFFRFNRTFLLIGLIASFGLALCRFSYPVNIEIQSVPVLVNLQAASTEPVVHHFDWKEIAISGIYVLGIIFLISCHLLGLYKIRKMIKKKIDNKNCGYKIIDIQGIKSSFSLFGYVFMDMRSDLSDVEKQLILEHEKAHIEQKHWLDVVITQVVCMLLWFNPFVWLYLSAVKQNHEYLADCSVLKHGHSLAVYNATLINNLFKIPIFTLTSSFTYNKLNRITMMKKNNSKPAKKLAVLLIAPALGAFSWAFAKPEYHYSYVSPQETENIVKQDIAIKEIMSELPKDKAKTAVSKNSVSLFADSIELKAQAHLIFIDGKESTKDDLNDLHPENIKSFSILKDKSATDLYGEKGKNGVILITTKKKTDEIAALKKEKAAFFIRELSSTDKEPLILIDEKESAKDDFNNLHPENIKSFSVLKDKTATELYGEKGENGVIIITTKKKTDEIAALKEKAAFFIRELSSTDREPLILIDEKESTKDDFNNLHLENIESFSILKDKTATDLYGEKGKNGVIRIITKKKTDEIAALKKEKADFFMRELSSTDREPLILIDGKESTKDDLNNLHLENIESFSILKHKTVTEHYGEKGENGVIIITMKKK
jgi:TonB-dependent SusC/RagA subfamily outer membrane receptor